MADPASWLSWLTPWWPDWAAFVQMGRHGAYVWPAVAACVLALGLEWATLRRRAQRLAHRQQEAAALNATTAASAATATSAAPPPLPRDAVSPRTSEPLARP
jgi:heme exporter protein CcmD